MKWKDQHLLFVIALLTLSLEDSPPRPMIAFLPVLLTLIDDQNMVDPPKPMRVIEMNIQQTKHKISGPRKTNKTFACHFTAE